MPKTPGVILREKMYAKGLELLDIYHRKDGDLIRFKDRISGKVYLYATKKHVRDLVEDKEYDELVEEMLKQVRSS